MVPKKQRDQSKQMVALFSLLNCNTRCLILMLLAQNKTLTVQEIAAKIEMSHSATSHQLGVLVTAKIVTYTKDGRISHYQFDTTANAQLARRLLRVFEHKQLQ